MKLTDIYKIFIFTIGILCTSLANAVGGVTSNSNFDPTKEIEDMRVKVAGGYVRITRHWTGIAWQWNSRWEVPEAENSLTVIRSNAVFVYSRMENGKMLYEDSSGNTISKAKIAYQGYEDWHTFEPDNSTEVVWRDRDGNKIVFDLVPITEAGQFFRRTIKSYSNRNDVNVVIEYNEIGQMSGIKDHNGKVVVTFTWVNTPFSGGQQRLAKVTDYTGREVVYAYKDTPYGESAAYLIKSVTDVRNEEWQYNYSDKNQLLEQVDPVGRVTKFVLDSNGKLSSITYPNGNIVTYTNSYDTKTQLSYSSESHSSGKLVETWSNTLGKTVRQKTNGELDFSADFVMSNEKVSVQYYYAQYRSDIDTTLERHRSAHSRVSKIYCDLIGAAVIFNRLEGGWFYNGCTSKRVTGIPKQMCGNTCMDNPEYVRALRADLTNPLAPHDPDPLEPPPHVKTKVVTDARGNKTTREYDQWKNEIKVTYADGSTTTRTWHSKYALPLTETDENGVVTEYQYDDKGNVLTLIEAKATADERTTRYTYDEYGQVKTITTGGSAANNTALATTAYEYDEYGNVTRITDALNHVLTFSNYDVLGNAATLTDARASTLAASEQYTSTRTFDEAGNVLTERDPDNRGTTYTYTPGGDLASVTEANNSTTSLTTNARGLPLTLTDVNDHTTKLDYDKANRLTAVTDANGNIYRMTYDARGRLATTVDGENNTTRFNYAHNQLAKVQYPSFSETLGYDNRDRVKESKQQANSKTYLRKRGYDLASNLTGSTDAESNSETYEYDKLQRVTKVTDAEGGITTFSYDARDNLREVKDPERRLTVYRYDLNDQLLSETKHDAFTTGGDITSQQRRYSYDANGNLGSSINPAQEKTTYQYDRANRLVTTSVYATTNSTQPLKVISYNINAQNQFTGYSQTVGTNAEGNPVAGITPDIIPLSETYSYTTLNQIQSVSVNFGSFSKSYSYTYYPNGLKNTYTNPEGITYTYYYNKNNQLTAVHIPGHGQLTYGNFKWLMPQTLLLPGGNKITLSYNDFLQVETRILKDPANNEIAKSLYEYDLENNINQITSEQGAYSFNYDNLYRLTAADYPLDTAANDEVFVYDGVGNRTGHVLTENTATATDPTSTTSTLDYNNQNQLTQSSAATYSYSANGHTETKIENGTTTDYIYNHEERLIAVKVAGQTVGEYAYNPYGMRIKKTANGQTRFYLYNDKGLAAEYDASGNLIKEYFFHPQKTWMTDPLFQRAQDGQVYYYQNDHLGTSQRLVKSNGATVWSATYNAFGEAKINISTVENNLRFPGQYFDEETGLHQNYYRDYDPKSGRYIQTDPIGLWGGLNVYVYALNNSLNFSDAFGLVVKAEYNKNTGMVTVTDADSGATATAPAFSGTPGLYDSAPNGTYSISHFPWLNPNYYAIVKHDEKLDDYADGFPSNYNPDETLGHLRLHPGSASHGCVTVPRPGTSEEWQAINNIIANTKPGDPITIDGVAYPNYGTLTVTGEGFGSVPNKGPGVTSDPIVPTVSLPSLPQLPSQ